jgi:hypothetical protein
MGDVKMRLTTRLERGGTFLFLALVMLASGASTSVNAQAAIHRAGLVVRFGDGSVVTRCVTFSEPSLTGAELLMRAGLSVVLDLNSSIGAGVCKIGNQGCDRGKSCFCQCEGSTCAYWQYFHLQSGVWKYSNLGAGVYQVSDGAVEGWAWGNNVVPPVMSLDQICAAAPAPVNVSPTPTRASAPTATPRPATPTVSPTTVPATIPVASVTAAATVPTAVTSSATVPPTDSPTPQPTLPPSSTRPPAPTVVASPQNAGTTSPVASYAVFGVIVLGLGAWLMMQRRKAR